LDLLVSVAILDKRQSDAKSVHLFKL
jgi:hypothetical protein